LKINGTAVTGGIAIGKVQMVAADHDLELGRYSYEGIAAEIQKYAEASKEAEKSLDLYISQESLSDNEKQIMNSHKMLLNDFVFSDTIKRYINNGIPAPEAITKAVAEIEQLFMSVEDAYLKERAADVKDVGNRLIRILTRSRNFEVESEAVILIAEDIESSLMAALPKKKVKGILLGNGSQTSHAVIIAKSKGFIISVGVDLSRLDVKNGDTLILDTRNELAFVNPPKDILKQYKSMEARQHAETAQAIEKAPLPAKTLSGKEIIVAANISQPSDMEDAQRYGCQGVGLFRTEFMYMGRKQLPTEEEQFDAYRDVVQKAGGEMCVIRTADIGGDKPLEALRTEKEANPFLGWRGIRIGLRNKAFFMKQIKAILRAGAFGHVAMMIPMVVSRKEITQTKQIVAEAMAELDKEHKPYEKHLPIGIMVETPAAVLMAPALAKHVDFFSIGTNDLTQYVLAVDRQNHKVADLYDYFHPAVIRAVHQTIKAAHQCGKWAGICGEMASDDLGVSLLVALDVDELSMAPSMAPKIKELIRRTKQNDCDLGRILEMTDAEEIRDYLKELRSHMGNEK